MSLFSFTLFPRPLAVSVYENRASDFSSLTIILKESFGGLERFLCFSLPSAPLRITQETLVQLRVRGPACSTTITISNSVSHASKTSSAHLTLHAPLSHFLAMKTTLSQHLKSVLYLDRGMLVLNKLPGLTCQLEGERTRLSSPEEV